MSRRFLAPPMVNQMTMANPVKNTNQVHTRQKDIQLASGTSVVKLMDCHDGEDDRPGDGPRQRDPRDPLVSPSELPGEP